MTSAEDKLFTFSILGFLGFLAYSVYQAKKDLDKLNKELPKTSSLKR